MKDDATMPYFLLVFLFLLVHHVGGV